jgi:5-(carboxyamino)imidazole ribonucleotide synthase
VVTLEIEQIGIDALVGARKFAPLRPAPEIIATVQDRARQKRWLIDKGFPVGTYREVAAAGVIERAFDELGALFVKASRGGYDGRSQLRVLDSAAAAGAWSALGERSAVAEQALDLDHEISVMVARNPAGEVKVYPPALNHHERQVLAWSTMPAPIDPALSAQAVELAQGIADALVLEGILAVEMFVTRDGRLLVNELAPRPHNSFHETEAGCATSQFEQLVRAICNLPLGDTGMLRPSAIVNIFGDSWARGTPDFAAALEMPGVRLHLYGKRGARAGRKMGHLSATGNTAEEALATAQSAARRLGIYFDSPALV